MSERMLNIAPRSPFSGRHAQRKPAEAKSARPSIRVLAATLLCVASGGSLAEANTDDTVAGAQKPVQTPNSIFISGHSLTNEPLPSDLAAIAAGFGIPLSWNRQYLEGSTIQARSGTGKKGVDRANQPIDATAEIERPAQHATQPYDVLLITEQHSILGTLVWNDTAQNLSDFHDRFIRSNPNGVTFFFEPWLSLDDKSNPANWIAYERAAAPVWSCVVEGINEATAAKGRHDRMRSLPASLALAYLIERATQGEGIPAITQPDASATLDTLLTDDVHLTRLGSYYMALVVFAYTFNQSPQGAWHPADVSPEQAKALQQTVADFAAQPPSPVLSLADCRAYVRRSFMWTYLNYAGAVQWRPERGYFGALYTKLKIAPQWMALFASDSPKNPFSASAYRRE